MSPLFRISYVFHSGALRLPAPEDPPSMLLIGIELSFNVHLEIRLVDSHHA